MPNFWKLSMGTHAGGGEFPDLSTVQQHVQEGYVLVWGPTGRKGSSRHTQGELFKDVAKIGDYFYLCHGNQAPGVLLLGKFSEPAITKHVHGGRKKWLGRKFERIKDSKLNARYEGAERWWTPDHNSTFVRVPEHDLPGFEADILRPYFGIGLSDLPSKS
ncbi:hypothetical protein [Gemmata sp. SH-PL17]|uniref:hypothetical protein n=1 Tax=Gemmata sp. SH-PL17 TaxID=1630693 RepID=UPI0012F84B62|nr:hypothetical protein [Gemmata sp. SH-PL17]